MPGGTRCGYVPVQVLCSLSVVGFDSSEEQERRLGALVRLWVISHCLFAMEAEQFTYRWILVLRKKKKKLFLIVFFFSLGFVWK